MISQADTEALPHHDPEAGFQAGFQAAEKVIGFLHPLLPVFLEAAIDHVVKTVDEEAVFNSDALEDAKQKIRLVQQKLKAATQPNKAKLVEYCGTVLGSVMELSTVPIHGESKTDQVARDKKMNKRFKGKLERIQNSLKDEGGRGLATSEGAGILMCNALAAAGPTVWEGGETSTSDWIRQQCILDFKGEIECDLCPLAKIVPGYVTLMVGEIKASIKHLKTAKGQMQEQLRLLEFGLWCIFGNEFETMNFLKEGHLFVLEAGADRQSLKSTFDKKLGISFFVHRVGH